MNTLISSQIFPVLLGWTTSSKPWTMLCWLHRICLNMFELNWTMLLYSQMPISCWWTPSIVGVDHFFLGTCPCSLLKTKQSYPARSGLPVVFLHTFSSFDASTVP
jgi:hypothetical protein